MKNVKATKLLLLLILLLQLQDGFSQSCGWFANPAGTHNICPGDGVTIGAAFNGGSATLYWINTTTTDTVYTGNATTLSPTVSTIYECHAVVTTGGCAGTYIATIGINVTACTGIMDQTESNAIGISRNGNDYVLHSNGNSGEVVINNVQGTTVKQFVITTDKSEYALNNLQAGLYIVSVKYSDKQKIIKIAVE